MAAPGDTGGYRGRVTGDRARGGTVSGSRGVVVGGTGTDGSCWACSPRCSSWVGRFGRFGSSPGCSGFWFCLSVGLGFGFSLSFGFRLGFFGLSSGLGFGLGWLG
jgi:hypothetical protein